jgi:hypothetical protein
MLGLGEHANEPAHHLAETVLHLLRRQVGHGRLLADDQLQIGDERDHERAVRRQRRAKLVAPARQLGFALA